MEVKKSNMPSEKRQIYYKTLKNTNKWEPESEEVFFSMVLQAQEKPCLQEPSQQKPDAISFVWQLLNSDSCMQESVPKE